jgi:hypothetical protein
MAGPADFHFVSQASEAYCKETREAEGVQLRQIGALDKGK